MGDPENNIYHLSKVVLVPASLNGKSCPLFFMLSIIYKFSKGDVKIFYLLSIKSLKSCTGLESRHNLDINHNTQACCAWLKIHTHTQKL